MKRISLLLILFSFLIGQNVKVKLDGTFYHFTTYYVTSFDLTTGSSEVQFFDYTLKCIEGCTIDANNRYTDPLSIDVSFEISIRSPALGITEETTIIFLRTRTPFEMYAPIHLDSRDFNINTREIRDINGDAVDIDIEVVEQLDIAEYESLLSSIITSGKLPNGVYRFRLTIDVVGGEGDVVEEVINVTTPTSLNLISPGGALDDTSQNIVYTPYPIFQWETEPCPGCESHIRIAKFKPRDHSSLEEAIEDVTSLPLDQTKGWEPVGIVTTFQYPVTGAMDLEVGKVYVWQIRKDLPTTQGIESYISPIWAFKIADLSEPSGAGFESYHPILQQLLDVLGEEQFNIYFGPNGLLTGFFPSENYTINDTDVPAEAVAQLLNQFLDQSLTIISISIE